MATRLLAICLIAAIACVRFVEAAEPPPIEAYGKLPTISNMALSPSGTRVAFRQTDGKDDMIVVLDLKTGKSLAGVDIGDLKPRDLWFVSEDTVFAIASETLSGVHGRSGYELNRTYFLDIPSNKATLIFRHSDEVFDNQTGLGNVVGQSADGNVIYMPAFVTHVGTTEPRYSLFHLSTDGKTERVIGEGSDDTRDWFVDGDGRPLVEVEYNDAANLLRVHATVDGERRLIYDERTSNPELFPVALSQERDALLYNFFASGSNYSALHAMSLAGGDIQGPYRGLGGADISVRRTLVDRNRVVFGVEYEGFQPSYKFIDEELDARVDSIQQMLRGTSSRLVDWTPDFETLLFEVSGGWSSGGYVIAEGGERPRLIAQSRPDIPADAVAATSILEYEARDGFKIPALLTARKELLEAGNMPLVVLPHGGPSAHDDFEFNWKAQFLASRGYAVLQPQFRGSTGFGLQHWKSGEGEWGARMSTDIDDGVKILIDEKLVDPQRICIVGSSYGGYAALAAGAFSDIGYKCIVSVAGVSDVYRMLAESKWSGGEDSEMFQYWRELVGADESELAQLKTISPVNYAENFDAPVLLIHGKDDTVVRINHSNVMEKALKDAGKDVRLIKLSGEDHWLSGNETRQAALEAIAKFLDKNL
ncbi:MAG: prolyl oligopeptidase family serine peptidase [Woeseiaceae bacterium]